MAQKLDFPLEIVVADDASTDNTRNIISEFLAKFPSVKIRFLDYSKNLGITKNYQRAFYAITTKYVAIMEGDDYWADEFKLQKQFDILENATYLTGCSANYIVKIEGVRSYPRITPEADGQIMLDGRMLIDDNVIGNFSTCMYRVSALKGLPQRLFDHKSYDWIVNIALCRQGPIMFLKDVMSVYRVHPKGTWSQMTEKVQIQAQLDQIEIYNSLTDNVFSDAWTNLSDRLNRQLKGPPITQKPASRSLKIRDLLEAIKRLIGYSVRGLYSNLPSPVITIFKTITPSQIRTIVRAASRK